MTRAFCCLTLLVLGLAAGGEKAPAVQLSAAEKRLFELLNEARTKEKLPPLKLSAALCRAARAHLEQVARRGKAESVFDAIRRGEGPELPIAAENLAEARGDTPADIHKAWLDSPGHRGNLLSSRFTEVGVAAVAGKGRTVYYVQFFGTGGGPEVDEKRLLELLNEARKKEKLPPLKRNATLSRVAKAHSQNMAKQGKMEHTLDGKTPAQRVRAAGYDYLSVGENIFAAEGAPSPADVHKAWMGSKIHRDNILGGKFTEIGLGIARGKTGYYYTQVFAAPDR